MVRDMKFDFDEKGEKSVLLLSDYTKRDVKNHKRKLKDYSYLGKMHNYAVFAKNIRKEKVESFLELCSSDINLIFETDPELLPEIFERIH